MKEIKDIMDLSELPDQLKLVKLDLYDKTFTKVQSDYYFCLLFGIDYDVGQKVKEELFNKGALIKVASEKDKKPTFYPCPPTFIYFVDKLNQKSVKRYKKEIEELEEIYYQAFCNVKDSFLKQNLLFISARGEYFHGLKFFLIKRFMKEEAIIISDLLQEISYRQICTALEGKFMKKTRMLISNKNKASEMKGFKQIKTIESQYLGLERMTIIDNQYLINVLSLESSRYDFMLTGIISRSVQDIKKSKEKFEKLYKIAVSP